MSVDWGGSITTLLVGQPHLDKRECRILKSLYVKHPAFINDLVEAFANYYSCYLRGEIEFLADEEYGDAYRPNSELTLNKTLMAAFRKRGWRIQRYGLGRIPGHPTCYALAQELLGEESPNLLRIRFNKVNCKDVLTAMLLAPVSQDSKGRIIDSKGRIIKVKASEKKTSFLAEHATHFTDNVDLHLLCCGTAVINAQVDFSQLRVFST